MADPNGFQWLSPDAKEIQMAFTRSQWLSSDLNGFHQISMAFPMAVTRSQ
jgi:hypothetical protein